jgi:hypothetical protein
MTRYAHLRELRVITECPLPSANPPVIVADRTKPQDIDVVGIEKDRQQTTARSASWAAATTQGCRLFVECVCGCGQGETSSKVPSTRSWVEIYGQLSTQPGGRGDASQSDVERFEQEFKPFARLDEARYDQLTRRRKGRKVEDFFEWRRVNY